MIFEHEIPNGSRLYFGKVAKKKREIENKLATFFQDKNFEEIITPNFSHSQHQSIDDEKQLIQISDTSNNQVALRADSTLDVARIITKRLGRTTKHKKWFYVQPVFTYPSTECYQIGAEWLECEKASDIINLTSDVLKELNIRPTIQIANINIVKLVAQELNISLSLFKDGEIGKLFDLNIEWLNKLLYASTIQDLEKTIILIPSQIKEAVNELIKIAKNVHYENISVSPLYYTAMKYYDDVYYRVIQDNFTIAKGGRYKSEGVKSMGFALYTDELLKILED
jgi:histidyl-tRNA synthetase